jgi:cobalamin biosynthesis protein CbiG
MANVRRLCELGMPPELAKEVAAQIEAEAAAITAADIAFTPAGNLAATDVQAALEELDTEKAAV